MKRIVPIFSLALVAIGLVGLPSLATAQLATSSQPGRDSTAQVQHRRRGSGQHAPGYRRGKICPPRPQRHRDFESPACGRQRTQNPKPSRRFFSRPTATSSECARIPRNSDCRQEQKDSLGETHLRYEQVYRGIPVFGSLHEDPLRFREQLEGGQRYLCSQHRAEHLAGLERQSSQLIGR